MIEFWIKLRLGAGLIKLLIQKGGKQDLSHAVPVTPLTWMGTPV